MLTLDEHIHALPLTQCGAQTVTLTVAERDALADRAAELERQAAKSKRLREALEWVVEMAEDWTREATWLRGVAAQLDEGEEEGKDA